MKRKLFILLALAVALTLIAVAPANAKKPLTGPMELEFNLNFAPGGAGCQAITWAGTVYLDGVLYEMAFIPTDSKDVGSVHHFWEDWLIYPYDDEAPIFVFSEDEPRVLVACDPGEVLPVLHGTDSGVTSPNDRYRMNGTIDGAGPPFEEWLGRNVHMSGTIEWYDAPGAPWDGAPHFAPGVFHAH